MRLIKKHGNMRTWKQLFLVSCFLFLLVIDAPSVHAACCVDTIAQTCRFVSSESSCVFPGSGPDFSFDSRECSEIAVCNQGASGGVATDPCDALDSTAERLRCRNARLFGQNVPAEGTAASSALALRVGTLIRSMLSLVGIIFLMITVYSGIQWMMAGGNEEVITKTKARITRAAIGLAIIVGSWVITNFILNVAFRGGPRQAPGTYTIPGTGGNVEVFGH